MQVLCIIYFSVNVEVVAFFFKVIYFNYFVISYVLTIGFRKKVTTTATRSDAAGTASSFHPGGPAAQAYALLATTM